MPDEHVLCRSSQLLELLAPQLAAPADGASFTRSTGTLLRILRVAVELDHLPAGTDPWQVMSDGDRGEPVVAWHRDAPGGLTCIAFGVCDDCVSAHDGPGRMAATEADVRRWRDALIDVGVKDPARLPFALGGFAFGERRPGDSQSPRNGASKNSDGGAWAGWTSRMVVPRWMVVRRGERLEAVFHLPLHPDTVRDDITRLVEFATDLRVGERTQPAADPDAHVIEQLIEPAPGERERYQRLVERARAAVRAGEFAKLVTARSCRLRLDSTASDPLDASAVMHAFRQSQPHCTTFRFDLPHGHASFVGATPEVLLDLRGRELTTTALAGTRRRGSNGQTRAIDDSLLHSTKDSTEQAVVVDTIVDTLRPLCEHIGHTTRRIARFANVQHIETPLVATLREPLGVLQLVARLHPTPAVGGAPREAAQAWIDANEGLDRGWYAGPVGWISSELDGCFVVALRSVVLRPGSATAFAGGGIVADSDPAAEWDETTWKLSAAAHAVAAVLFDHRHPHHRQPEAPPGVLAGRPSAERQS
ncbi:MAG: isochorismate synthase MenF [Planctomycetota bacterium]